MLTMELFEGRETFLPENDLREELAIRIQESGFVDVEFPSPLNKRQFVLRTTSAIGLIPIDSETMLRIVPKVPVSNLFGMLEFVHELPSFQVYNGIGQVSAIEDIYERLARMLARGVLHRVRKGLDSDYVALEEDISVVRGRVDIQRTLRLNARGSSRLHCAYEARTIDINRNRVLLWALDCIPRLGLSSIAAIEEVRDARRALLGSVTLTEMTAKDCKAQEYNRLNSDYGILHALARFFLERMGPGIAHGDHRFIPFTVNMATLFQEYVTECLKSAAPSGLAVHRQHRANLTGDFDLRFQMDAVVTNARTDEALVVVDAKYKTDAQPSSADIHQVVAYAAHLGAPRAILVYPTLLKKQGRATIGHVRTIEVATVGLPLDSDLQMTRAQFANHVFAGLRAQ